MKAAKLQQQRSGFTLIEVIVSVIIISIVVMSLMEIQSRSKDNAVYLSQRNKAAFLDSYYLIDESKKYDKSKKSAYDLLQPFFHIEDDKTKDVLKKISREVIIPEPISLPAPEESTVQAEVTKVILKDQYSSSYYQFKLNSL